MNELIKIQNESGKQTVNARELWEFLESKKDFSDWIKRRIEHYGFEKEKDFTTIQGKSTGGRPIIDYYVTLEMGKELSMVENTEKGRAARNYFIECEKKLKENPQNLIMAEIVTSLKIMNKTQLMILNRLEKLENKQIEKPKDKADYIGEFVAGKIREKETRKKATDKIQLFLFDKYL
jgi:anti-repressor protein